MNRLIIVGNGFDLAHGMKTSYNDFMKWYLVGIFNKGNYDDDGVATMLNNSSNLNIPRFIEMYLNGDISQTSINLLLNNSITENGVGIDESLGYYFNFKYSFLKDVCIQHCEQNWVDIEELYYRKLLQISLIEDENQRSREVLSLNKALNFIKRKLNEYLNTLEVPNINPDVINVVLDKNKYLNSLSTDLDSKLYRTIFLNFNYTSTIDSYVEHLKIVCTDKPEKLIARINIHGEIKKNENPIIFGFGDER